MERKLVAIESKLLYKMRTVEKSKTCFESDVIQTVGFQTVYKLYESNQRARERERQREKENEKASAEGKKAHENKELK